MTSSTSTAQHTPGTWNISDDNHIWAYRNGETEDIAVIVIDGSAIPEAERAANARLIASAPELLEACRMAYHALNTNERNNENGKWIKSIIAKALPTA